MSNNNDNLIPLDPNFNMYRVHIKGTEPVEPVKITNYRRHSRPTSLTHQNGSRKLPTAMTLIPASQHNSIGRTSPLMNKVRDLYKNSRNKEANMLLTASRRKRLPRAGGKRRTVRRRATLRHRRRQTRMRRA